MTDAGKIAVDADMRPSNGLSPLMPGDCGVLIALGLLILAGGCRQPSMEKILRVGLPEEPRTLNIWLASDANSRNVLRQIYQPLYEDDPATLDPVPWLAQALPEYDAQRLTYTIVLRKARWSDGRPLTSADVAFTARLIQEFKIPGLVSRWKDIDRIETPDAATIVFHLARPLATFLSRTLEAPIVPAHQWQPIAEAARKSKNPLTYLLNYDLKTLIGCGPYILKKWRRGDFLYLEANPNFFGTHLTIDGRTLGPYLQGLLFKILGTTDVAMLALREGSIDMFWQGIQPGYIGILEQNPNIRVYMSQKSAIYFMGLNTRRPPFDDLSFRRAVAFMIDREFIIKRLLQGRGSKLFSIIPPGNQQWYDPDVPHYGDGMTREQRIRRAFEILSQAGYFWRKPPVDAQGDIVQAEGLHRPDGVLVAPFTILTPPADYDPARAISGIMIQEWLRWIAMPAYARPMDFNALIDQIKNRRDFDAFILGYGRLSLDPDYLATFFESATDRPRGLNMSGFHDPLFDRLAQQSETEMDEAQRVRTIFEMQQIIMSQVPYIPLYVPTLIEAVRTDRFQGWVQMLDGIGNRWSFTLLKPAGDG